MRGGKVCDSYMDRLYEIVVYGLAILIVAVSILAEFAQAYRSKSVRSLCNRYTLGYIFAFLLFLLRLTIFQGKAETPFYMIMFYLVIVDYLAMCLIVVYCWHRGVLLVATLFGKSHSYETKMPKAERLKMCRFSIWAFGVYTIIFRAGPFIVIWLFDIFGL